MLLFSIILGNFYILSVIIFVSISADNSTISENEGIIETLDKLIQQSEGKVPAKQTVPESNIYYVKSSPTPKPHKKKSRVKVKKARIKNKARHENSTIINVNVKSNSNNTAASNVTTVFKDTAHNITANAESAKDLKNTDNKVNATTEISIPQNTSSDISRRSPSEENITTTEAKNKTMTSNDTQIINSTDTNSPLKATEDNESLRKMLHNEVLLSTTTSKPRSTDQFIIEIEKLEDNKSDFNSKTIASTEQPHTANKHSPYTEVLIEKQPTILDNKNELEKEDILDRLDLALAQDADEDSSYLRNGETKEKTPLVLYPRDLESGIEKEILHEDPETLLNLFSNFADNVKGENPDFDTEANRDRNDHERAASSEVQRLVKKILVLKSVSQYDNVEKPRANGYAEDSEITPRTGFREFYNNAVPQINPPYMHNQHVSNGNYYLNRNQNIGINPIAFPLISAPNNLHKSYLHKLLHGKKLANMDRAHKLAHIRTLRRKANNVKRVQYPRLFLYY